MWGLDFDWLVIHQVSDSSRPSLKYFLSLVCKSWRYYSGCENLILIDWLILTFLFRISLCLFIKFQIPLPLFLEMVLITSLTSKYNVQMFSVSKFNRWLRISVLGLTEISWLANSGIYRGFMSWASSLGWNHNGFLSGLESYHWQVLKIRLSGPLSLGCIHCRAHWLVSSYANT